MHRFTPCKEGRTVVVGGVCVCEGAGYGQSAALFFFSTARAGRLIKIFVRFTLFWLELLALKRQRARDWRYHYRPTWYRWREWSRAQLNLGHETMCPSDKRNAPLINYV